MSKMNEYYIDLWNAAFELKSIATKWGINIEQVHGDIKGLISNTEE